MHVRQLWIGADAMASSRFSFSASLSSILMISQKVALRLFARRGRISPPPPSEMNSDGSTPHLRPALTRARPVDGLFASPSILRNLFFFLFTPFFMAILLCSGPVYATTLIISHVFAPPGDTVTVPIIIDQIDNLAGIKIVLSYDKNELSYVKAVKGMAAASLMHVVNDRNPGRLIIVMAGARGIKGKNIKLMNLTFKLKPVPLKNVKEIGVSVNEIQVMDDKLKEVDCKIQNGGIRVIPLKKRSISREKKNERHAGDDSKKKKHQEFRGP